MIKGLVRIANKLDSIGLAKEADILDSVITKIANDPDFEYLDEDFNSESYDLDNSGSSEEDEDEEYFEDDYDFENFPEGIGTTEPKFTGGSPEESMITRMSAASRLREMSDDEFEELRQKYPDILKEIFGKYSITPSGRVL